MKTSNLKKTALQISFILICFFGLGVFFLPSNKFDFLNKSNLVEKPKTCKNCNVLLIDIDILQADALSCYGNVRNTTPNICKLAKKGLLFKNNYAPNTWTFPSIFSTVTSSYAIFHRVGNSYTDILNPDIPTLAQTLQQRGYQTGIIMSWDNPAYLSQANGGTRGYDYVINKPLDELIDEQNKGKKPWFIHYYIDSLHLPYVTDTVVEPIEPSLQKPPHLATTSAEFSRQLDEYLQKNYKTVFTPKAIAEHQNIFSSKSAPEKLAFFTLANDLFSRNQNTGDYLYDMMKPTVNAYLDGFDQKDPSDLAYVKMMYDTKLRIIDEELGKVFDKIQSSQNAKDTIIVIMSDHGENFGEYGKFNHVFDGHSTIFRTPLIINSPTSTGEEITQPTSNLDIFPTILELANIPQSEKIMGTSLLHIQSKTTPDFIMSEADEGGIILQNQDWFFFSKEDSVGKSILYNKKTDPTEQHNVVKQYPELAQSLYNRAALIKSYAMPALAPQEIQNNRLNLSPEKLERLQKEGYF